MTRRYTYRPLLTGANSIRLLRLLPASGKADIRCQIFDYQHPPEQAYGPYEALSYTWGDTTDLRRISIEDDSSETFYFNITANLYTALLYLRESEISRTIWADAICINQEDIEERGRQVQIMAGIYSSARGVVIWLGKEGNCSTAALKMIRASAITNQDLTGDGQAVATNAARWLDGLWLGERMLGALLALLSRPWFRRIWVLQETAAARSITIKCGRMEITGSEFCRGLRSLSDFPEVDKLLRRPIGPLLQLMAGSALGGQDEYREAAPQIWSNLSLRLFPLAELLDKFHAHEATDRRDKIFALLGMSTDHAILSSIRPDYTKCWSSLFQALIAHILGPLVWIRTWDEQPQAVIYGSGVPLGMITRCNGRELVLSTRSPYVNKPPGAVIYSATWHNPAYAKGIRPRDVVCLLDGAQRPMVIRSEKDYFKIIVISLPPPVEIRAKSNDHERRADWPELVENRPTGRTSRNCVLLWDLKPFTLPLENNVPHVQTDTLFEAIGVESTFHLGLPEPIQDRLTRERFVREIMDDTY